MSKPLLLVAVVILSLSILTGAEYYDATDKPIEALSSSVSSLQETTSESTLSTFVISDEVAKENDDFLLSQREEERKEHYKNQFLRQNIKSSRANRLLQDDEDDDDDEEEEEKKSDCVLTLQKETCPLVMKKLVNEPSSMIEMFDEDLMEELDDCDCYNFCGTNRFANCCKHGHACSVSCDNAGPIIAGCTWDDKDKEIVPTPPPTPAPPSVTPPYDPNAMICPMQRNQGFCPSLIEDLLDGKGETSEMDTMPEDCDCLNFCGEKFVSCCSFNTACSMQCDSLSNGEALVAGCRLDPDYEYPPSPSTSNYTMPMDDTPPSHAMQPEATTLAQRAMCPISQHTELCPSIMARTDISKIPEDCECLNFCGTNFEGCCTQSPFNLCSISCTSLQMGDKLVAGCKWEDLDSSTVTEISQPPPPPEVPEADPQAKCPISQHTDLCPALLADATDMTTTLTPTLEGCECANFCGTTFQGCCSMDPTEVCSISCQNLQLDEVLVAGCRVTKDASDYPPFEAPEPPFEASEPTPTPSRLTIESEASISGVEPTIVSDEQMVASDSPTGLPTSTTSPPETPGPSRTESPESLQEDALKASSTKPSLRTTLRHSLIFITTLNAALQLLLTL